MVIWHKHEHGACRWFGIASVFSARRGEFVCHSCVFALSVVRAMLFSTQG